MFSGYKLHPLTDVTLTN